MNTKNGKEQLVKNARLGSWLKKKMNSKEHKNASKSSQVFKYINQCVLQECLKQACACSNEVLLMSCLPWYHT